MNDACLAEENSRPGDESQVFGKDSRYGRGSKEPISRLWKRFLDACHLCGVDVTDCDTMLPLIQTTFLCVPATVYFTDVVKYKDNSTIEALKILVFYFSDDKAKHVNDDVWLDFRFDFIKSKHLVNKRNVSDEAVLVDLPNQISELSDMRTGYSNSSDILTKTISAVRDTERSTSAQFSP